MKSVQVLVQGAAATGPTITSANTASERFTVTYQGFTVLDQAEIRAAAGAVTVVGPLGNHRTPRLVGLTSSPDGGSQIATYSIAPPGGFWSRDDNGVYPVNLAPGMIAGDSGQDLGGRLGSFTVNIDQANAFLDGRTLIVAGTSGSDVIRVTEGPRFVRATVNGQSWVFPVRQVTAVKAYGYEGSDRLLLSGLGRNIPAYLDAGSGNDLLWGGPGKNTLVAGSGNNVLVSGWGTDQLYAGPGNDVLVAGRIVPSSPLANAASMSYLTRLWAVQSESPQFRAKLLSALYPNVQNRGSRDQVWDGPGENVIVRGRFSVVYDETAQGNKVQRARPSAEGVDAFLKAAELRKRTDSE
jgi:hypothetical protein